MRLISNRKMIRAGVFVCAVALVLMTAGALAYAGTVTGVSADPATLSSTGGESVVTVTGEDLIDGIVVGAFDIADILSAIGATTGDSTSQTAMLTFLANTSYDFATSYTIKISLDDGENWDDSHPVSVTVSKSSVPALNSGIDYESVKAKDPIIIESTTADDFEIDLTKETLIKPSAEYNIKHYSVDGGKRWIAVKSDELGDTKFPNLFSKDLTLQLCYDYAGAVGYVEFPKINKRPVGPKIAVNYLICADPDGVDPGEWVLTSKEKGMSQTEAYKGIYTNGVSNLQIGVADPANKYKTVDGNGFCQFFPGVGGGIPVEPTIDGKVAKPVFFVRYEAKADGSVYTPASKLVKLSVPGVQKAPSFRIDYKTETIKLKSDFVIAFGDYDFKPANSAAKYVVDVSEYISDGTSIYIKKIATAKSAISEIQEIDPLNRADVIVKEFTCTNGKIDAAEFKPYEVQNPTTKKWGALPKVTVYNEYECDFSIRLKSNANNSASLSDAYVLRVKYGYISPSTRLGVVEAAIVPVGSGIAPMIEELPEIDEGE